MPRHGTPLLDRLRRDTRPLHDLVQAYRSYLAALLGFHRPLEAQLAGVGGLDRLAFDLAARWKTRHLEADLTALGLAPDAVQRAPIASALPRVTNVPAALGTFRSFLRWIDV